ncbi:beta-galactosidase [Asticcacaulis sp. BYS171W]|uniref:Beta-galactosidase n=1 Tax=Asticcacaulis aquaticus TaxID=2984212 RepID=A0ABT5HW28_9CAUL|nr:beta-galactosidase [Asticcacaulis aquaticus]MDC7684174.1 beta-galactosidase [Asticcacaulis aquaticus]
MLYRPILLAVLLSVAMAGHATAQNTPVARATRFADKPPLAFGTAWYPEQWPEAEWDADLTRMKRAGFNVVRIGEFAWSRMEPEEGRYDFAWLDAAIDHAVKHGMMVVLGTPTAAPPAWLTQKYPEVLRVDENGTVAGHGGRRHFSFASPKYRELSAKIASEMARRYGKNPHVVGWQIDNEIGPPSFDPASVTAWHRFLENRYGTIDTLNARWTTQYWSQFYNSFDQVPLRMTGQQNPGLLLDFKHFATDTWTAYIKNQVDALRPHLDPRAFITTNTMFWNAGFDHYDLHKVVDIAAWDNYIPDGRPDWVANGTNHDLVHGYKQQNFWLMETQGRVDWVSVNRALDPGQMREMAWQAIGHGGDAVVYWQWRPARNGQETYHGALMGQDGLPTVFFPEVAQTGKEITAASAALADTVPVAKVALLWSYDSRWAIALQPHHKDFDPVKAFLSFYKPLRVKAQGVHVLPTDANLSAYSLVVAPNLNVMSQAEADHLKAYVEAGGHLVLGPRSGMKDDANALWPDAQPGPLRGVLKAKVEQYFALDQAIGVRGAYGDGKVSIWAEWLTPEPGTEVVATYADPDGWLDGKAAVVTRKVGKGRITYVGAWLDEATMGRLADRWLSDAKIEPVLSGLSPDIEVMQRSGAGKRVLIVINHGKTATPLPLRDGATAVTGDLRDGQLPAHGVAVVQIK